MYSVIIPTKNESANIGRCIRSVFESVEDSNLVEVIVVDNGSSDNTREIANLTGAKVCVDANAHISGLRNLGAKRATFNIFGFIDADCEALPGWLNNARGILSDKSVGIVGDYYRLPEQAKWIERAYFSSIPRKKREVSFLSGGNMVMLRDTFLEVGGFNEEMITCEDYAICLKLKSAGLKILSDPSVSVVHYGNPHTLTQLFKREVWCGLGMIDLYKYGKIVMPLAWSVANIVLIGFICSMLAFGRFGWALMTILLMLLLPGGAGLMRCLNSHSYRHLLPLYVIFMVYGFARTVSIFKRFGGV